MPSSSTSETTILEPFNAQELSEFDSLWEGIADGYPNFAGIKNVTVRRVITCALFSRYAGNIYGGFTGGTIVHRQVTADNANTAILAMCIQSAVTGQRASGLARGAGASNHCSTALVSLPVKISRSGSLYTVTANTTVSKAHGGPLAVSCQVNGNGIVIKLRARKRGRTLPSILGPKFSIGYSNQSTKSVGFRATFRFS